MEDLLVSHDLVIEYHLSIHDSFQLNEGSGARIEIIFHSSEGLSSSVRLN